MWVFYARIMNSRGAAGAGVASRVGVDGVTQVVDVPVTSTLTCEAQSVRNRN